MPEFKEQITTGNVIQIVAMLIALAVSWALLIALAVSWALLDARGAASAKRIDDHEVRLRAVEAQLLTTLTRIDGRLGEIERALKR